LSIGWKNYAKRMCENKRESKRDIKQNKPHKNGSLRRDV
jgi:hypothetical protein